MSQDAAVEPRFPDAADEFEIRSHPIFLLTRGEESEVLVFDARMRVRTAPAVQNARGQRQVDVEVSDWVATTRSNLLDQEIVLRLEGDQPPSMVTAQKFDRDFPARLEFRMNWAVEAAGQRIDGLESTAVGTISAFPPKLNDKFEIQGKDLSVAGVTIESLLCAC